MSSQNTASNLAKPLLVAVLGITLPVAGYAFNVVINAQSERITKVEIQAEKVPVIETEMKYLREAAERIERMIAYELQAHGHHRQDFSSRGTPNE